MITVLAVIGIVVIAWVVITWVTVAHRRRSLRRAASSSVEFEGAATPLDRIAWALAWSVGAERVTTQLIRADPKTPAEAADSLRAVALFLTEDERVEVAERVKAAERVWAERAFWDLHTQSLWDAYGFGMLDAFILAAGGQADWAADQIGGALEHFDVSRTLIEHALNNKYDHFSGYFEHTLLEHSVTVVDGVAGHAIDVGVNTAVEGAGHALSAIADAHIPVVTIIRSIHRAKKSSDAGLDPARVGENLVLDVGFKGGGIAAGAMTGALIGGVVPIVGHIIGGLVGGVLGGLLGGNVAEDQKQRYLREATARSEQQTEAVGNLIGPVRWAKIASGMRDHGQRLSINVEAVDSCASNARRGLVPPLAHYILVAAAKVGSAESQQVAKQYDDWLAELTASSGQDAALFRGAFALTRPDLYDLLGVDRNRAERAIDAHAEVQNERKKLALAHA